MPKSAEKYRFRFPDAERELPSESILIRSESGAGSKRPLAREMKVLEADIPPEEVSSRGGCPYVTLLCGYKSREPAKGIGYADAKRVVGEAGDSEDRKTGDKMHGTLNLFQICSKM